MPIRTIQIKRTSGLSSPSTVTLADGELLYKKPTSTSDGKLYVGDGVTDMSKLKDITYGVNQRLDNVSFDVSAIQGNIGKWNSANTMSVAILQNAGSIASNSESISNLNAKQLSLNGLLTDSKIGIYTANGSEPTASNAEININNIFSALNRGVDDNYNWNANVSMSDPGSWASNNRKETMLHFSKIYGVDARVGYIFDKKYSEKGIFGKDFIINKTVDGVKHRVIEFIRGEVSDTANIGGGSVEYGTFLGQKTPYMQSTKLNSPTLANANISGGTVSGTISADGAVISSSSEKRVRITNPTISNPLFDDKFISKTTYFADGVVDTHAIKNKSITAEKLADGAIPASAIKGTNRRAILYSESDGTCSWGDVPNGISGNGSASYIPVWSSSNTLSNSRAAIGAYNGEFLAKDGTWKIPPYPSLDIRVDGNDIVKNNGVLSCGKKGHGLAIMSDNERGVTDSTTVYVAKMYNSGKILRFVPWNGTV